MTRHNKKRNSGLLYEFLLRSISRALVEQDDTRAQKAKDLLTKYFSPGNELHKEYRLINALVNVSVGDPQLSQAVLEEARRAAVKFNSESLRKEKSDLIREINHFFGPEVVYNESVENYKEYASASSLIKYWRDEKSLDIATVTKYEKVILERLSLPVQEKEEIKADPNVDNLVVNVARQKLEKKYEAALSSKQKEILNEYAFSDNLDDFHKKMLSLCDEVCVMLEKYSASTDSKTQEKANSVTEKILEMKTSEVDDNFVSRIMEVASLRDELLAGEIK